MPRLLNYLINLFIILLAHKLLLSHSMFLTPNMLSFDYIIFSKYSKTLLWNWKALSLNIQKTNMGYDTQRL